MSREIKGTLIKVDGSKSPCIFHSDKRLLDELREMLPNTCFEFVRTIDSKTLVVDEDGLSRHLPKNPMASKLYSGGLIVGDVILLDISKEDIY